MADTFSRVVTRGEYRDAIIGWYPTYVSPAGYLIPLAQSSQDIPAGAGYGSPQIDALLQEAALSTDPAEQDALYTEVQQRLLDTYALVPLFQGQDTIVYRQGVTGVQVEANSWLHYETLAK
jgi:peptide/nickel transport system substrate-binding protein